MAEPERTPRPPGPGFSQLDLTSEEKAVLLQCRRNSLIRGFVSGSGLCMILYWFRAQGRVPAMVSRSPGFFYAVGFFGAFVTGYGSYQKICYQKIMSLENSSLKKMAQEYEKAAKEKMMHKKFVPENDPRKSPKQPSPGGPVHLPREPVQRQTTPPPPPPPPPGGRDSEGPSINEATYNQDRLMLETREELSEQPSAFSGGTGSSAPMGSSQQQDREAPRKKGRTFDEIREEHRFKNSQQRQYPTSPTTAGGGASRTDNRDPPKKRNKYGDVIEP